MQFFIKRFLKQIGVDWAILYTLFARGIQAIGGLGTVLFIAKYLGKKEQGFYYTFGSIIAIQIFFELGLNTIITQYVAHEMAHLTWDDQMNLQGEEKNKSRLASLLHFCIKWFSVLAIALFFTLLLVGYVFFTRYSVKSDISWQGPYLILCLSTSCFLVLDPLLAFIEGLSKVKEVARFRLIQQTSYIFFVITLLATGFQLYAGAIAAFISFIFIAMSLLFSNIVGMLKKIYKLKNVWTVNYKTEILPYQWKIALSWISGYFIFHFFNPVLFATEGPVVAGQMGMTVNALNGILALSMSWIYTKVPLFSNFISLKKYFDLDDLFFKSFWQSVIVNLLGVGAFFIVVQLLNYYKVPIGNRFLSVYPLALLCLTFVLNQVIFSLAVYLRCHKTEPLLWQSIVLAILSFLSTISMGRLFGVKGITSGYFGLMLCVSLPWVIVIFNRFRNNHITELQS
jgi:O-antigen/teichoic acid export membrane protein